VRGDDELRARVERALDHRQQPELALRRQRGLRLVEDVEAARHQPFREEVQERFAV
jgi:hypothetical protein